MVNLIELNEENWPDFAGLSVDESQKTFLASNIGIIARGYVYRNSRAKVIGIVANGTPVGLAMVRDMEDEPACYELQQFMIDKNFQRKGYGLKALERILAALKAEELSVWRKRQKSRGFPEVYWKRFPSGSGFPKQESNT